MRLLLVLSVVVAAALATDATRYDGYKVFQLTPTASQMELLSRFEDVQGYDFWSRQRNPGAPVDIMVAPAQQRQFIKFLHVEAIENKVLIEDVQVVFDKEKAQRDSTPRVEGKITFDRYYDFDEISAYLDEMAATYPNVATVEEIGTSTNGQIIKLLKISSGGTNKPIIWFDAAIHAREWSAPAMALYTINQLLEVPGNEGLYADRDWWILPVANPDGYAWTFTNARLWRKTRSTAVSTACPGIDPNRNFDFHWNEGGTSQNPCSEIYSGPNALSEPEVRSMVDVISASADRIKVYVAIHSYGWYFLYPWGWTSDLPPNWQELQSLAEEADAAQQAAGGRPYTIGSSTNVLSPAAGCSDDWALGPAAIPISYALELPGGGANGFDPPASQIQNMVTTFFPAIKVLAEYVV